MAVTALAYLALCNILFSYFHRNVPFGSPFSDLRFLFKPLNGLAAKSIEITKTAIYNKPQK